MAALPIGLGPIFPTAVETGEPAFHRVFGMDSFSYMALHPEEATNFDKAMSNFTRQIAIAVTANYDFPAFDTIIDVGGGDGTLLAGILAATPNLRGILFEQPHVAERAKTAIAAHGLASRCTVVAGDFFRAVPAGGDAYILKHVIHDWDDERATKTLENCRQAMGAAGRLLIVEGVYPPRIDPSEEGRGAASNDVNMLVCTGGRQRSEDEFRALLKSAGFRLTRIVPTPARVSMIEGVRA